MEEQKFFFRRFNDPGFANAVLTFFLSPTLGAQSAEKNRSDSRWA